MPLTPATIEPRAIAQEITCKSFEIRKRLKHKIDKKCKINLLSWRPYLKVGFTNKLFSETSLCVDKDMIYFQPLYLNAQFHNYWFKTLEILSPYFSPKIKSNTQRDLLWVTFKREEFTGIFCSPLSDYMYSYMIKEGVLRKS